MEVVSLKKKKTAKFYWLLYPEAVWSSSSELLIHLIPTSPLTIYSYYLHFIDNETETKSTR